MRSFRSSPCRSRLQLYDDTLRGEIFTPLLRFMPPRQLPVAERVYLCSSVIMDYKEYVRLREIEQERKDYHSAAKTKAANKKWTDHQELKKELGLEIAKGRQK